MSKVFSEIFIFKYIYIHYIRTLKKLHVKDCGVSHLKSFCERFVLFAASMRHAAQDRTSS